MKFTDFDIDSRIQDAVAAAGYIDCTPVQQRTLTHVLQEQDVMVQSQTGTGKTAAYLVPALHFLLTHQRMQDKLLLVIAPTRELAEQISAEAALLSQSTPIRIATIIGGVEYGRQVSALRDAQVMIGTPGRIIDHVRNHHVNLKRVGILVIDEADRMFDMGFYPSISTIIRKSPARDERLTMLLSATLSLRARNIAWRHMHNVVEIEIAPEQKTVKEIEQKIYHLASNEKISFLVGYLRTHSPSSAIIFTNMRSHAEWISKVMNANGLPAQFISGALPQKKRSTLLAQLKSGTIQYLVATDVAARGLHVDNLGIVVNYDLPENPEDYVHRIGRTARAGKGGLAISFACEKYVYSLPSIEKYIDMKIPVSTIEANNFATDIDYRAGLSTPRSTRAPSSKARTTRTTRGRGVARGGGHSAARGSGVVRGSGRSNSHSRGAENRSSATYNKDAPQREAASGSPPTRNTTRNNAARRTSGPASPASRTSNHTPASRTANTAVKSPTHKAHRAPQSQTKKPPSERLNMVGRLMRKFKK